MFSSQTCSTFLLLKVSCFKTEDISLAVPLVSTGGWIITIGVGMVIAHHSVDRSWAGKQSSEALTPRPHSQPLAFIAPRHLHGTLGFHRVQIGNHCFSQLNWHVIFQTVRMGYKCGFYNKLIPNHTVLATYKSTVLFYVNQLDHCQPGWLLKAMEFQSF